MPSPAPVPAASVRVRLFASLRDQAGWSERSVNVGAGATPLAVWRQLALAGVAGVAAAGAGPAESALPSGVRVAINQQFAAADAPLAAGDELAFLPPITGG
jgi:molybdopterin synthase sulfur carrier subunit